MLDLTKKSHCDNLWKAMKSSWESLAPFRKERKKLIEDYVGSEWGTRPEGKKAVLINMLAQTASTYMMALASNRPRVLVNVEQMELVPFAKQYQVAVNNLLKEMHFERTLRRVVLDAFFSIGVVKIYWANSQPIEVMDPEMIAEPEANAPEDQMLKYRRQQNEMRGTIWVDPGKPMVEALSLDEYGFDVHAGNRDKARFHYHIYRATLEAVQADDRFDPELVGRLKGDKKWVSSPFDCDDMVKQMTEGQQDVDDVEPMVTLIDVYLPFENVWAVFAGQIEGSPLMVSQWKGPEGGPFRHLSFDDVPDNAMPLAPGQNLKQLNDLVNSLMRHQANQARRQKDIIAFMGDEKDARAVKMARDGELIRMADPTSVAALKFGGVDQMTQAFYQVTEGIFSRAAGNLDAMAGLGPQSSTAKQDAMIHGAVSRKEAKMQYSVVEFVTDVVSDLGYMMWVDQQLQMSGTHTEPGLMFPIQMDWTPDQREGDFVQYNFDVEPYSMAYQSPQQRLQQVQQAVQMLAPLVQMTGGAIDTSKLVEMWAELANLPQLKQLITFPMMGMVPPGSGGPGQPGEGGPGQQEVGPPQPREYIRRSVSTQGSPSGQRTSLAQHFTGAANQQGQQNAGASVG